MTTHVTTLPYLPAATQGKITLGPSVTMGGGHVGPCLPIQPHHEREEEISEDPRALLQQMRKISHRRGASMDSFLAPHRWGEGEGHHTGGGEERERHLTGGGEGQLMGGWRGGGGVGGRGGRGCTYIDCCSSCRRMPCLHSYCWGNFSVLQLITGGILRAYSILACIVQYYPWC